MAIYPKSHFVTPRDRMKRAVESIKDELEVRRTELEREGRLLEAQRLHQRTMFDLEMIQEIGYCHGIENYARHLSGRAEGQPPPTLLDYLPGDALMIVDESHQTVPQVRGMFRGDRPRKEVLVEYGFRLPSALDNRPLTFGEWARFFFPAFDQTPRNSVDPLAGTGTRRPHVAAGRRTRAGSRQVLFVSATPGPYELRKTGGAFVEQIIRPTGLVDPPIEVRPVRGQVDDLLGEIRARAAAQRARARHDAHQAHGRGPDAVLPGTRRARALPALGHRHARARRDPARPAARARSTCSSASTCCARGSTCRRCRWSRCSTPTRRGSCGRAGR